MTNDRQIVTKKKQSKYILLIQLINFEYNVGQYYLLLFFNPTNIVFFLVQYKLRDSNYKSCGH